MSAAEAAGPPYSRSGGAGRRTATAETAFGKQEMELARPPPQRDLIDAADIADDAVGAAEGRQVAVSADEHDVAEGARFAA